MKGAQVNESNTAAFGTITDYKSAGNYEFNTVKNITGNAVELQFRLSRTYEFATGLVQLVRVPYYAGSVAITSQLTCVPWNGLYGGVLVFFVKDSIDFQSDIDVSAKGFRKGIYHNTKDNNYTCGKNDYFYPINTLYAAGKGEGIAIFDVNRYAGHGLIANGGGGGMDPNTGGGGGSNGNAGGRGGNGYGDCPNYQTDNNWGLGGMQLSYSNSNNKIFLGGAGGAGHCNNGFSNPSANTDFNGGNGGGIVLLSAAVIKGNGRVINASGEIPYELTAPGYLAHDGMGGGGAGGTVLIKSPVYSGNININIDGARGANMSSSTVGGRVGPGGGGGGGVLWLSEPVMPAAISVSKVGGIPGVILQGGNDPYGAMGGLPGVNLFNLALPIDNILYAIPTLTADNDTAVCAGNTVQLSVTGNISNFSWNPPTGLSNTSSANPVATPASTIMYFVSGTDMNGCTAKDSVLIIVNPQPTVARTPDTSICHDTNIQLAVSGGLQYTWQASTSLSDINISNPIASPTVNSVYRFRVIDANKCYKDDSIKIMVKPAPVFAINESKSICNGSSVQLLASGGDMYTWSPAISLDNANLPNPVASPVSTITYGVHAVSKACNDAVDLSTVVQVSPLLSVRAQKSNDIDCNTGSAQLTATGAHHYEWTPVTSVSNPTIPNPQVLIDTTTYFVVKGMDEQGCAAYDSVQVVVSKSGITNTFQLPNVFSPNGDYVNDCFGIRKLGAVEVLDFSIYNRWGQKIFTSKDRNACWDGTYKGKPQDPGGFVYIINAKTHCGTFSRKGMVLLVR